MKKWIAIIAAIACAATIYGVAVNWPTTKNQGPLNPSSKSAPVAFDASPDSYQSVSSAVWKRKLKPVSKTGDLTTAFTLMTDTGIKFDNFFSRDNPNKFMETGCGLAIGDYDNDGLQDVYMVGAEIENKLYRNLGNFEFEDVTETAGVNGTVADKNTQGAGATFADIDNDGFLDLFVCNMGGPNLLYSNQGDGTFIEQASQRNIDYVGASKVGSFCDYDRDGDLDLYLLTYQDFPTGEEQPFVIANGVERVRPGLEEYYDLLNDNVIMAGEHDILYQNNGDGTFKDVTVEAGIEGFDLGLGVVWSDFDNDGWQDIFVTSDYKRPDHLYRNQGDGTFKDVLPDVVKRTPWFSMGTDSGDINNDGLLDFAVADMAGNTHYRQKVDMGEMLEAGWFLNQGEPRQLMKNCLFVNSGTGPFLEAASMAGVAATNWTWALRFVDMDNDGMLDLFATTGHARDSMNADLNIEISKMTKGGDAVYCAIPARKEANLAFKNLGNLDFENVESKWGLDHVGVSHGAAFADLDGDGDLDLVVNNYYENSLVYRNDSTEGARVLFEFRCRDNNFYGVGTRVEIWQGDSYQTRTLTPTRGYISSDPPQLHFGSLSDAPIDRAVVTWPDGTVKELNSLEFNHSYRLIEESNRSESSIPQTETQFVDATGALGLNFYHSERTYDDFLQEPLLPYKLSELGSGIAWADVNGDGLPDLFCGGAASQPASLFINEDGKSFTKTEGPWKADARSEDTGCLFFDCDQDGDQDLYVVSGSNEWEAGSAIFQDRLYLNDGKGKFTRAKNALPEFFESGSCVTTVDFDHDGDLDLFVGSRSIPRAFPQTPRSYLLQNDGGKFTDVTEAVAPRLREVGLVNSAIWSDFDGDGWSDLIIALEWGPVAVFRNQNGSLENVTGEVGLSDALGWWRGIAAADLDDDGDMDYVVSNQGTNTKYHADTEHPHRLYFRDFDSNGTLDLVEAEFENGIEVPVRGRSCSSRTMPFIADKYKKYEDFALASVPDIYETDKLEVQSREVNRLESSILWNDNGKFRLESLPRMAQISPAFGVVVNDFDGDGFQDIYMANNFFASQVETGRMDGGLSCLLYGKPENKFAVSWPNESGISINQAAYSAAMADFDGDGDLDVATGIHRGPLRLLANQATNAQTTTPKSEAIQIVWPVNDSKFVGAQLRLIGEGFSRLIEINCGNNYLSQSSISQIEIPSETTKRLKKIQIRMPGKEFVDVLIEANSYRVDLGKALD